MERKWRKEGGMRKKDEFADDDAKTIPNRKRFPDCNQKIGHKFVNVDIG